MATAGRDIGELPSVVDPDRRDRCRLSFRSFCNDYFPETFALPWSQDHLTVLQRIEQAVLHGGLFAMAMPRGSGKTSLCETACLWSLVYGHRDFVALVGASEAHADEMLSSLKAEIETNDRLLEDFPEVCFPVRALEGIPHRCGGQLYQGERTRITWTAGRFVLPTIPGALASGAIVKTAGITGRIRGMKHKRSDGKTARPSLVICDDLQTDESAHSLTQCESRARLVAGAVLGLAGPGKRISGILPCTVIRPGDMADTILDATRHPEWNGSRMKLLYSEPTNAKLWEKYGELRAESLRQHNDTRDATAFYAANREKMDAGAVPAWPERFLPDQISAIQYAMDLKIQDERSFQAEYQNDPLPEDDAMIDEQLTIDQITQRVNGFKRGIVPADHDVITVMVDVQKKLLFWKVVAWKDDFSGAIIDYGSYPDQKVPYFTLRDAKRTLAKAAPGAGLEGSIRAGLDSLEPLLIEREWLREDGVPLRVSRMMVDANWSESTEVVYAWARASKHAAIIYPSHGVGVGASSKPMTEYDRKRGDKIGHHWMIPLNAKKRAARFVRYDVNFWKSFIRARLLTAKGDKGALSIFGRKPADHQLLAEHFTSEYSVRTAGRGREVDEWKLRPGHENHWWDCVVGAAVAASIQGVALPGAGHGKTRGGIRRGQRVRLSDVQRGRAGAGAVSVSASASPDETSSCRRRVKLSDVQRQRRTA